ncbi:MAG: metal-sensitive transcriptional regulator [Firmicutes bacterium]|mgnify:FL=1|jgi:DNA-binding FrmR family transcriptional regulator|nr:metal-sensitive transcriptional regulator [Bacillota bacterium]
MSSNNSDKDKLLQRLKRIEGQIRGIHRMVSEEQYCVDILTQVAAARAALDQVGLAIFENHTRECIMKALSEDESEKAIGQLMEAMNRFLK